VLCGVRLLRAGPPPAEHLPPNVFVELQIVDLPRKVALPLVRSLADPRKMEEGYARVQDLLDKGTAKLIGWPTMTVRNEQRAVVEATDEYRYATAFSPGGTSVSVTEQPNEPTPGEAQPQTQTQAQVIKLVPVVEGAEFNAVPTEFETRNLGVTLEAEPEIAADGMALELNLVVKHTWRKGVIKSVLENEKTHDRVAAEQPEFCSNQITASLALQSGERTLLGVYPAPEPADHLELFFLRAEIRKAP
jgi:hypothetical protein